MAAVCDVVVVGGGPAGLSAAINGASEGLRICLLDAANSLGGQAVESSAIENYPLPLGLEDGVTGRRLVDGFILQARKFDTSMYCPASAAALHRDGRRLVVTTDDYSEYVGRAVILANGLNYRRHAAEGLAPLMGRGVSYGMPAGTRLTGRVAVGIIGGANSAGQAAVRAASNPRCTVHMFVRGTLEAAMSTYLVDRIRGLENVLVSEGTEVVAAIGRGVLEGVTVASGGVRRDVELDALFIFIGATPRTMWLRGMVQLDDHRYIRTGIDVVGAGDGLNRLRLPHETSQRGVFACGDVRAGSTKRIAAAIGEGACTLAVVHRFFSMEEE